MFCRVLFAKRRSGVTHLFFRKSAFETRAHCFFRKEGSTKISRVETKLTFEKWAVASWISPFFWCPSVSYKFYSNISLKTVKSTKLGKILSNEKLTWFLSLLVILYTNWRSYVSSSEFIHCYLLNHNTLIPTALTFA